MHILATYAQKEVDNYPKSLYNKVCMTFAYAHLAVFFSLNGLYPHFLYTCG